MAGLSVTEEKVVPAVIEYSTKLGPAYAAGLEPASTKEVENVPVTAGEVAGEAGPVRDPKSRVVPKPGGSTVVPEPVH